MTLDKDGHYIAKKYKKYKDNDVVDSNRMKVKKAFTEFGDSIADYVERLEKLLLHFEVERDALRKAVDYQLNRSNTLQAECSAWKETGERLRKVIKEQQAKIAALTNGVSRVHIKDRSILL